MASDNKPFVVLTYAPSGMGKTTDMGYSFPTALFLAAPGALSSIEEVCGYTPKSADVKSLEQATQLIKEVGPSGKFKTVVIDDFSFMAEQTAAELEARYSGFGFWGKLRDVILRFRDTSRYAGVNVVLNAWEQLPKKKDGKHVRGGPKLSGQLPEQVPALCDLVLRGVHEPGRQPWPVVYRCSADPDWTTKDRFNIVPQCDPAPMNLAEILRAANRHIPRHPDFPKMEERVQVLSERVDFGNINDINEAYSALLGAGISNKEATWTMRDAFDRAVIRRDLSARKSVFIPVGNGGNLL